jgi:phage FluMu gp28-like protein
MVLSCESPAASVKWNGEARPGLYWGFDIARKRDLSVIWIVELLEDGTKLTRGVITMLRMKFHEQKAIASEVAKVAERGCIDATGIGANLAEDLSLLFPGRIEAVEFNSLNKESMAIGLKTAMEERKVLLPDGDVGIRRSIQSVKQYKGSTGAVRFDAARTEAGHADEFWALALACSAAQKSGDYVPASEVGLVGRTVMGNMRERSF